MPATLPRPMTNLSSNQSFGSDTATLPHPINLTITTPQTSLARGDWGFKRPLPLRSTTKSSTPLIRIDAIDTYEQVTDYASSADHAITLKKWEEMGVHMTTPQRKTRTALGLTEEKKKGERDVFDDSTDSTIHKDLSDESRDKRWRFDGPWIAGLTDGDFNAYVSRQVRGRKTEFLKVLRAACAETATKENQRIALERGEEVGQPIQASDVTEEEFRKYLKTVRHDRVELYRHIRNFLDLPPSPNAALQSGSDWLSSVLDGTSGATTQSSKEFLPSSDSPYADSGPPKTHPSAGLSYGRTSAHTFNHPLYGPQNKQPPVQARVVMPKGASPGSFAPVLGVGGFVVDIPAGENSFNLRGSSKYAGSTSVIQGLINVEPDKIGGSKAYVELKSASVDTTGRVILKVGQATADAVAVLEGNVDQLLEQQMMETKGFARRPMARSGGGYGLSSGDFEDSEPVAKS